MNDQLEPENPSKGPDVDRELGQEANASAAAEAGAEQSSPPEYILVALDVSPHAQAALDAAADLAAALHLELRGLYVEDVNLIHLSGLPFSFEVGSFTAKPQRLEQANIEREFRIHATNLRKIMADVAGQRHVVWSFQVVRGGVTDQLLAASLSARMLSLGRVGRSPGKRTGSTAQAIALRTQRPVVFQSARQRLSGPYTVVHTGTPAAQNALLLGMQLAAQEQTPLTVLVYADLPLEEVALQVQSAGIDVILHRAETLRDLLLTQRSNGAIILPIDVANWLDEIPATVIVTP